MNMVNNEYLARCAHCDFISYASKVKEHIKVAHVDPRNFEPEINSKETVMYEENTVEEQESILEEVENIPPSDSTTKQNNSHQWNDPEVKLLISLYEENRQNFEGTKMTNRSVWQRIANSMTEAGYPVTWEQCDNKFKNLKKSYKKVIDNNNKTGRGRIHFKYFDLLDHVLSANPNIHPVAECNTLILNDREQDLQSPSTSSACETPHNNEMPQRNKKRRQQHSDEEPMWFKTYKDVEKRHREKMQMQDRFISVIDKFLNR
ncbi:uncharacterized protein LOC116164417 [Photinus pyralis]|uniref:uncharacterized protein LOC116164417 n=1 Tax=Photinus pyralis TaxID=7054 RepID=UPI001267215D|nr:uncharacterized protein LOC116164417 [Photinus pyralis]